MKVSLNTIKQYAAIGLPVDELVAKINGQLGGVEQTLDLGERYKDAVIAGVTRCEKHPNADKLSVCEIDAGTGENIQVVCGAPNVREGIFVVWLPPSSTVPSTFDDKEPFVLEPKELRGVMSNGMLASARELGIGDSHDGILEIDPNEWRPSDVEIKPGASFAAAFGFDDTVIDIENKMFTHRPDLFGQLGVAREIAGIQHNVFSSPDWYKVSPEFNSGDGLELAVKNDALELVPRFMAVAIKNVTVKPSPLWLQCELVRLGAKPINNIVDATNYIMLLTAQPTHAYDYDKLRGHQLGVRMAKMGESITLLNHRTYELDQSDIVIVDGEGPVGLAGIMGGGESEVGDETTSIVLEVATFDMYAVRKSSMRHGVFTDALTRFNKGQSPHQNPYVLGLLMSVIADIASGETASEIYDEHSAISTHEPIDITPAFINERLGLELGIDDIRTLLENVEFAVEGDEPLRITAPFWRTDIERREDIIEEVGRLYGFDALPRVLPRRSIKPTPTNSRLELKRQIRSILSAAGANEVLTYSFVHENVIKKAGQDSAGAYRLGNALSPDLQFYRLSVLPSLLDKVHANIKAGHDEFALFELGKAHHSSHADDDGLPTETHLLDMVYTNKRPQAGAAYYRIRRLVERLADELGLAVVFEALDSEINTPGAAPFVPSRSAVVKTAAGAVLGIVGELKPSVRRSFKLPEYTAAATIAVDHVHQSLTDGGRSYQPLSRFPKVTQDISLKVGSNINYAELYQAVYSELARSVSPKTHQFSLSPVSIYQPELTSDTKTVTLRLEIVSFERTLTDKDVTGLLDAVAATTAESLGAERV